MLQKILSHVKYFFYVAAVIGVLGTVEVSAAPKVYTSPDEAARRQQERDDAELRDRLEFTCYLTLAVIAPVGLAWFIRRRAFRRPG